jgi:hypothetical protein
MPPLHNQYAGAREDKSSRLLACNLLAKKEGGKDCTLNDHCTVNNGRLDCGEVTQREVPHSERKRSVDDGELGNDRPLRTG